MAPGARVGVDVGGTFTDIVLESPDGLVVHKVPSTPHDPSEGFERGLREALVIAGHSALDLIAHGTTVATNAVLERKGAVTGFVATEGFRDILHIGRQNRPRLYDFEAVRPAPLVPRTRSFEVAERVGPHGEILQRLDVEAADEIAMRAADEGCASVAVCLLFSFADPQHERLLRRAFEERAPGVRVSLSHEVLAEFREYERASTTVLDAYVGPVVEAYLDRIVERVQDIRAPIVVMRSGGGTMTAGAASSSAVHTLLSGPAAGVIGASSIAARSGISDMVTFDMGGTSTDVCLVVDGEPSPAGVSSVGDLPLGTPALGIHTVGAGGGSIVWKDPAAALRVGPHSAGADPGPACYGRGGEEPTITDAHLVLGHLDAASLLGGRLPIDPEASHDAFRPLAADLGVSIEEVAAAALRVVRVQMAKAIRVVTVEKGRDPRELALAAFGGAGAMHACALASELEMTGIVIPPGAGVASALGLLVAPLVGEASLSRLMVDPEPEAILEVVRDLEERARRALSDQGADVSRVRRLAECRYLGQAHEVAVEVDPPQALWERFHEAHDALFGWNAPDEPAQVVTLRVRAEGPKPDLRFPNLTRGEGPHPVERRPAFMDSGPMEVGVFDGRGLGAEDRVAGPALIRGEDSTVVLEPGWIAQVHPSGTLLLSRGP